jgi:hypothetical protein
LNLGEGEIRGYMLTMFLSHFLHFLRSEIFQRMKRAEDEEKLFENNYSIIKAEIFPLSFS